MRMCLFLVCYIPFYSFGACNHHIVDRSKHLACVTIKNDSNHAVLVTSLNGVSNLKPKVTEEFVIIPGNSGSLKVLPNPFVPYFSKALTCTFATVDARKNRIVIAYTGKQFSVVPSVFFSNCHYTDITHKNQKNGRVMMRYGS